MLRPYFQRHRRLLKRLCALAHESLAEHLRTALGCPQGLPGIILTLHTFGEYLDFHPHIHALVADGLFLREALSSAPAPVDDAAIVRNILRHLGLWIDPRPRPPPAPIGGCYTYEPCEDVDPPPTTKTP
ncbi:MAG TPA: transposase [Verrucomicrobiae bacterium]|nr:transposase [Verrucomicrobiae bacterium]